MLDLEKLKNPDNFYRCAPFWSWNDNLKEEELLREITEMHQKVMVVFHALKGWACNRVSV